MALPTEKWLAHWRAPEAQGYALFVTRWLCLSLTVLISSGCSDSLTLDDAGPDPAMDAAMGARDAGEPLDAGPTADAANPSDAGEMNDGGVSASDAGAPDSGGSSPLCTAAAPCGAGAVCTGGPGCGVPWTCDSGPVACTDDIVEYCGCDGRSFTGSSNCTSQPWAHMGPCAGPDGFDCDRSRIRCRALEPTCGPGLVAEVEGSCWTFRCVPLTDCRCRDMDQCPGDATCDSMRCKPADG